MAAARLQEFPQMMLGKMQICRTLHLVQHPTTNYTVKNTNRYTCRGSGKLAFMSQHWKKDKNFSDTAVYSLGINIIITESEHNV